MPKNNMRGHLLIGVLFTLTSIVCFAAPLEKTTAFWIAYAFAAAAFVTQPLIWKRELGQKKDPRSRFLSLPVAYIGGIYLVAQTAVLAAFLLIPTLPTWSAIAACSAITGAAGLCLVSANAALDEIGRTDDKVRKSRLHLDDLRTEVELLADREADPETEAALRQLADRIRFSDPMSHEQLVSLEEQIALRVSELGAASNKTGAAREIELLLSKRNKKCRILK